MGSLIIACLITVHHATPHNGYIMYGDALEKEGGGGGGGGGGGAGGRGGTNKNPTLF